MRSNFQPSMLPLKRNSLVQLGAISVLTSVLTVTMATTSFAIPAAKTPSSFLLDQVPANQAPINQMLDPGQFSLASAGMFEAGEAPTSGAVRIVTEDGHRYLEIDSAFATTDQAPDLHVLLDTAEMPPASYSSFGSYINLGSLQSVTGSQRYPIPDSIDLSQYHSVVIWCRMANATIGYATLR